MRIAMRAHGAGHRVTLGIQYHFAWVYSQLGMNDEALQLHRERHAQYLTLAECDTTGTHRIYDAMKLREDCFLSAADLADALIAKEQFAEAKSLLREQIPMADETCHREVHRGRRVV